MVRSKIIACAAVLAMMTACSEPDGSPGRGVMQGGALNKRDVGTAAGVVGGAVLGSTIGGGSGRAVAMIAGGLLGGALGNSIGGSLDNADQASYDRASQRAMESGSTQTWRNSESGNYGTIRPNKRYRNADGQYCREYTQSIIIDGRSHKGHGTACREADGTWEIVE